MTLLYHTAVEQEPYTISNIDYTLLYLGYFLINSSSHTHGSGGEWDVSKNDCPPLTPFNVKHENDAALLSMESGMFQRGPYNG